MRPIVLLLAGALLAACGPDDGDTGVREYRKSVERLCRESERQGDRLAKQLGDDLEDVLPFFRKALELGRRGQERVERVDPPDALAEQHGRSVELGRRGLELLEDLVDGLERTDNPVAALRRELPPLLRLVDKSNALAREMKLDDCVVEPIAPDPDQDAPS